MGLEGILQKRRENLVGILNGIDTDGWSPQTDTYIEARYSASDLRGKDACKRALQREVGLPIDPKAPLFGFISRLDHQKGVDLIEQVLPYLLASRSTSCSSRYRSTTLGTICCSGKSTYPSCWFGEVFE